VSLVITNATVVGPTGTRTADIHIRDGLIAAVGTKLDVPAGATVLDATGQWVGPAFVDLHTHLREPGREEAETIASGANAAAVGGYGAIVAMPNTEPALDNVALVGYVLEQGAKTPIDVAVAGAITVGRAGQLLAPMAEMAALGVRLFTDDGNGVQSAGLMRRALSYAKPLGVTLAQHCEDDSLAGGVMNDGPLAARLGLLGRSALGEELMVMRDIELVRATGTPMHFLHLSTKRSLAMVRAAQAEGLPVTGEVAPHHLLLDETACEHFDPLYKVHPPLRTRDDVDGLRAALRRGDIDAVATDHAPHAPELKDMAFDEAPAGMLGLEHAASITFDALGGDEADPVRFFQVLSRGPARIAQLRQADLRLRHSAHGGDVAVGEDANLVIFDPRATYIVDRDQLQSRATNTPYHGRTLRGRVTSLIAKGRLVVHEGALR
jgi:dihydroorotase